MALNNRVANLEELTARLGHLNAEAEADKMTDTQLLRICGLEGHNLSEEELDKELRRIADGGEVRSK